MGQAATAADRYRQLITPTLCIRILTADACYCYSADSELLSGLGELVVHDEIFGGVVGVATSGGLMGLIGGGGALSRPESRSRHDKTE